jgi:hypothetical protein
MRPLLCTSYSVFKERRSSQVVSMGEVDVRQIDSEGPAQACDQSPGRLGPSIGQGSCDLGLVFTAFLKHIRNRPKATLFKAAVALVLVVPVLAGLS